MWKKLPILSRALVLLQVLVLLAFVAGRDWRVDDKIRTSPTKTQKEAPSEQKAQFEAASAHALPGSSAWNLEAPVWVDLVPITYLGWVAVARKASPIPGPVFADLIAARRELFRSSILVGAP